MRTPALCVGALIVLLSAAGRSSAAPSDSLEAGVEALIADAGKTPEDKRLHRLFQLHSEYLLHEFPEYATYVGARGENGRWTDKSAAAIARRKADLELPAKALSTIDPSSLDALLHPTFDPKAEFEVLASGVSASPGAAKGEIVFTAKEAVQAEQDGRDVILVRPFTEADDVAGFHAAKGILTSEGGKASHAALVARGMGVPAVTGADL